MRLVVRSIAAGALALATDVAPAPAQTQPARSPVVQIQVCSAVVPNAWRNDLVLPPQVKWTATQCQDWGGKIGAQMLNLGCLNAAGLTYDFDGGDWNTCGW